MRCRKLEAYWEDWLDGKEAPELAQHLRDCAPCSALAQEMQELRPLLAELRAESPQLSPAFWARWRERLETTGREEAFWDAFNLLAGRTAAVLAALLLLLSLLSLQQPEPTSITGIEVAQETALPPGSQMTGDEILVSLAETELPR